MKPTIQKYLTLALALVVLNLSRAEEEIGIEHSTTVPGATKPIPVALDGFTGEAAEVLKFDLYVQGYSFVTPDAAQYLIHGSGGGNLIGTVTDKVARKVVLSRSYSGASVRREAHFFANDIVQAGQNAKGIGLTKIAFKAQAPTGNGEIYVADFDGAAAQRVTSDSAIVAKPAWVPGHMALYYTYYARDNPDIFFHNLSSSGQRHVFAGHPGLNTSAAVSPDGSKVAMILSQGGQSRTSGSATRTAPACRAADDGR